MCFVYVIQSQKNKKRYVGFTTKSVAERLDEHNSGKNPFTRQNRPFVIIYSEKCTGEKFARRRERFFKTGNGRSFLKKIIPL